MCYLLCWRHRWSQWGSLACRKLQVKIQPKKGENTGTLSSEFLLGCLALLKKSTKRGTLKSLWPYTQLVTLILMSYMWYWKPCKQWKRYLLRFLYESHLNKAFSTIYYVCFDNLSILTSRCSMFLISCINVLLIVFAVVMTVNYYYILEIYSPCFISHLMQQRIHFILETKQAKSNMFLEDSIMSIHRRSIVFPACKRTVLITWGVVRVVVLPIVSSIWAVCTSRVSNWFSNLSINAEICRERYQQKTTFPKSQSTYLVSLCLKTCLSAIIYMSSLFTFSKFILFSVASIDLTTPDMDLDTWAKNTSN